MDIVSSAVVQTGESIDELAVEYGFEIEKPDLLSRGSDTVDPQLLAAIFRAPKPVGEQSVFQGVSLGNGGYAVFSLQSVRPGLPEAIPQDQRDSRKQNLAEQHGRAAAAALVTASASVLTSLAGAPRRLPVVPEPHGPSVAALYRRFAACAVLDAVPSPSSRYSPGIFSALVRSVGLQPRRP